MSTTSTNDAKRINNVLILVELLRRVSTRPSEFIDDTQIRKALRCQGTLASLSVGFTDEYTEKHTVPMSLNTLKKYSSEILTRGFEELDQLRKNALESIVSYEQSRQASTKRTKHGLLLRVSELERLLDIQRQSNLILLQAISHAMNDARSICNAPNEDLRIKRTRDALQAITAILSLNPPPLDKIPTTEPPSILSDYRHE